MGCGASKQSKELGDASSGAKSVVAPAAVPPPPTQVVVKQAPQPIGVPPVSSNTASNEKLDAPPAPKSVTVASKAEKPENPRHQSVSGGALKSGPLKTAWGTDDAEQSTPLESTNQGASTSAAASKNKDLDGYEPEYEDEKGSGSKLVVGRPFRVTEDMTVKAPELSKNNNNKESGESSSAARDSFEGDLAGGIAPLSDVPVDPKAKSFHNRLQEFIDDPALVDLSEDETLHTAMDLKENQGPVFRKGGKSAKNADQGVDLQPLGDRLEMQEATVSGLVRPTNKKAADPGTFAEPLPWDKKPALPEIKPRKDPDWLVEAGGADEFARYSPPQKVKGSEVLGFSDSQDDVQSFKLSVDESTESLHNEHRGFKASEENDDVLDFNTFGRGKELPGVGKANSSGIPGVNEEELRLLMGEDYDGPLKGARPVLQTERSDASNKSEKRLRFEEPEVEKRRVKFEDMYDDDQHSSASTAGESHPRKFEKFQEQLAKEEEELRKKMFPEQEEEQEYRQKKDTDPWANLQSQYQIGRDGIDTPAAEVQFQRPLTAELGEGGELRRGRDDADASVPEGVVLWDGVQPISNVAESEWQPVEDLGDEDFDADYDAIMMPQPSVMHIEHGYDDEHLGELGMRHLESRDGSELMTEDEMNNAEHYLYNNERYSRESPRMSAGRAVTPPADYTSLTQTPEYYDGPPEGEEEEMQVQELETDFADDWRDAPGSDQRPALLDLNGNRDGGHQAKAGRRANKIVSEIQPAGIEADEMNMSVEVLHF